MRIGGFALGFGFACALTPVACRGADLLSENVPFDDIYIGLSTPPTPRITEKTTDSLGNQTTYRWEQLNQDRGIDGEITSLNGTGHPWGGLVWGAKIDFAQYDITPATYGVDGGGTYSNSSPNSLHYQTLGVTLIGGYEYGINGDDGPGDGITSFLMILPFVSGGPAWAENEVNNGSGTYVRERRMGSYIEGGLRLGGYLTEEDWIYGVFIEGVASTGKVTLTFPGGYTSKLTLTQQGVNFGLSAGYRF
jgi:hypothetical protein